MYVCERQKGTTEDEMAGWHHWLNGHEFEWALGVGDEQGDLACCSPWGHKESDPAEQLNWTDVWLQRYVHTKRTAEDLDRVQNHAKNKAES